MVVLNGFRANAPSELGFIENAPPGDGHAPPDPSSEGAFALNPRWCMTVSIGARVQLNPFSDEISSRRRPYRVECTGSLPTSEVKRRRARSVLGWGTAWEHLRVLSAFYIDSSNKTRNDKVQGRIRY